MVERAQFVASDQDDRRPQEGHKVEHRLARIERRQKAPRCFQKQEFRGRRQSRPMPADVFGKPRGIQANTLGGSRKMR